MKVFLLSMFDEWCLGLRNISSVFKKRGDEVTLTYLRGLEDLLDDIGKDDPDGYHNPSVSVSGEDFQALVNHLNEFKPDFIGISVCSLAHGLAGRITEIMREHTDVPIVWGGIDPTVNPDLCIAIADIICVGEGEEAIVELADRMEAGKSYDDIPNIWVRKGDTVIQNHPRPLLQDLDKLPWPDFDKTGKMYIHHGIAEANVLPPDSSLHGNYPMLATRGCPFSCSFCCNSNLRELYGNKGYMRYRSIPSVMEEIESILKNYPNVTRIEFFDDVFGTKQSWLEEFADVFPKRIGIPFSCYSHPTMARPARLNALKRAGIDFTILGVQSGSKEILEMYNRKDSPARIVKAAKEIDKAGIRMLIDLMGAIEIETDEDYRATLDVVLQMPPGTIINGFHPTATYRNHPIETALIAKGAKPSEWGDGRNLSVPEETKHFRFWKAVISLAEFQQLGRETIIGLSNDPHLKENPEILESLLSTLHGAVYIPGTAMVRREEAIENMEESIENKDQEIRQLTQERDQIHGKRPVRWYLKAHEMISGTPAAAANGC